jgi:hypothetical protein
MNTMFRIYCEDVNRKLMEEILSTYLQSFTIIPASGFYKGVRENSVVIEAFETNKETVHEICERLASYLSQELVVYTEHACYITGTTKA